MTDDSSSRRRRWLAVLARAGRESLEQAFGSLQPGPDAHTVRAPEAGMLMVRARVGGTGNAFNFGEATVTRCAVRVGSALGVGYTLGRDARKAELVALFDALLQDDSRYESLFASVIEPLEREQVCTRENEAAAVASSRVEFFTMVRGEA